MGFSRTAETLPYTYVVYMISAWVFLLWLLGHCSTLVLVSHKNLDRCFAAAHGAHLHCSRRSFRPALRLNPRSVLHLESIQLAFGTPRLDRSVRCITMISLKQSKRTGGRRAMGRLI